jgi:hypothetical protein
MQNLMPLLLATQLPLILGAIHTNHHLAMPFVIMSASLALGLGTIITSPPEFLKKLLHTAWPSVLVLLIMLVVAVYTPAKASAISLLGQALVSPTRLFGIEFQTFPLVPGVGLAWLFAPLTATGLTVLLTPVALVLTLATLRQTGHSWHAVNLLVLAFASCPMVWLTPGSMPELPALGLLSLCLTLRLAQPQLSLPELTALIFLLGCVASSYLPFLILPVVLAIGLLAVWPNRALAVGLGGTLVAFAWHAYGFSSVASGSTYPPLTQLSLGQSLLPPAALTAALVVLGISLLQMAYHWRQWSPTKQAAWGLGTPLVVLALATLASANLPLSAGHILLPALPLVLHTLLKPNFKKS